MSTDVECRTIGSTLVVHRKGMLGRAAWQQAQRLADDPEHTVVVVDLPDGSPIDAWESVARALKRRRGSIRLVAGQDGAAAGQWLAGRLGRTVVAPDVAPVPTSGGGLYVPAGGGAGWTRFTPGQAPRTDSQRFPKPRWENSTVDTVWQVSEHAVSEPVPGGVWIRRITEDPLRPELRRTLVQDLLCHTDRLAVVLGSPGGPPLSLDDVAGFWASVPADLRGSVRFVPYGPVRVPDGTTLGQALADRLGTPVAVHTGLPSQGPTAETEVHVIGADGRRKWLPFVKELGYLPVRLTSGQPAVPHVLDHRAPLTGMREVRPGVYWYAPDAVLEIIQSGLWVRPPEISPRASDIRGLPVDLAGATVVFDDSSPRVAERMRMLACDVVAHLDDATRRASHVVAATEVAGGAEAVEVEEQDHWLATAGETVTLLAPSVERTTVLHKAGGVLEDGDTPPATAVPETRRAVEATAPESLVVTPVVDEPVIEEVAPPPAAPVALADIAPEPVAAATPAQIPATFTTAPTTAIVTTPEPLQATAMTDEPLAEAPPADDAAAPATAVALAIEEPAAAAGAPISATVPATEAPATEAPAAETPAATLVEAAPPISTTALAAAPTAPAAPANATVPAPAAPPTPATLVEAAPPVSTTAPAAETPTPPVSATAPAAEAPAAPSAPATLVEAAPPIGTTALAAAPAAPAAPVSAPVPAPTAPAAPIEATPPISTLAPAEEAPATPFAPATPVRTAPPVSAAAPATTTTPAPAPPASATAPATDAPATQPTPAAHAETAPPASTAAPATTTIPPAAPMVIEAAAPAFAPASLPAGFRLESAPDVAIPELDPFESMSATLTTSLTPEPEPERPVIRLDPARVQPVPAPQACAVPPAKGLDQERQWLRKTLSQQYDSVANSVARVLSQMPGLRVGPGSDTEVLADLVAVRLYLNDAGETLDDAVRAAQPGPHVPFARLVAAGLRRLPAHRGPAVLRVDLDDAQWQWYRETPLITEWACLAALAEPHAGQTGSVELRIWSMTGRRTAPVQPDPAGRVVFLPGTNFKVLRADDGAERVLLLRELSAAEIGADGSVVAGPVPVDDIALSRLNSPGWPADPVHALTEAQARRFGHPLGLLADFTGVTA